MCCRKKKGRQPRKQNRFAHEFADGGGLQNKKEERRNPPSQKKAAK